MHQIWSKHINSHATVSPLRLPYGEAALNGLPSQRLQLFLVLRRRFRHGNLHTSGIAKAAMAPQNVLMNVLAGDFMIFNYGILSIFEWLYDLYISLWYFEWVFKTPETGMLHPLEAFSDSTGSTRRQSTWRRGLDGLSLDLQLQKSLAPLSCLQRWVFLGEVPVKPKPLRASMGFPQQWVGPPNILWSFRRGIASNHMKYVVNKRYWITKCMCCTACDEACIPLHLVCICNILKMCHLFLYIIRAMYKYYTSHML